MYKSSFIGQSFHPYERKNNEWFRLKESVNHTTLPHFQTVTVLKLE